GKGKPLADIDEPLDELWWVKRKLKEEGVSFLPPALAIRREVELTREAIAAADTEERVRDLVTAINARIREVNRTAISGPPTTVMPMNVDDVVARWRAARG
ncbi:MAG TPA: DnaJ family domain-containing protein, partial [Mycobacteriales bacterium]|nr:DnaJ family domain-containing protein [Mycobacteriales bacterium]